MDTSGDIQNQPRLSKKALSSLIVGILWLVILAPAYIFIVLLLPVIRPDINLVTKLNRIGISSYLGCTLNCFYFFPPFFSMVSGYDALHEIRAHPKIYQGTGVARVGIVIGVVELIAWFLYMLLV